MMNWNLSDAKNRLSEVLDRAAREGPQKIRRRKETFFVVRDREYEKLTGKRRSFKDWLFNGPSLDKLNVRRGRSAMREFDL
jgi:antitoxin Phd